MGKIHLKKPRNSRFFLGNFGGFWFFLIFSDEISGGFLFFGINQLCNMFSEVRQNQEREWKFRSEKIESFSFRANLLSVFIFLKFEQKKKSIGDARRRNMKIKRNWKLNPYCQGIRRMRIGIPRSSANIRRGIPIFCPLITSERFWLVSRSNDNLKTAWIETKSIRCNPCLNDHSKKNCFRIGVFWVFSRVFG